MRVRSLQHQQRSRSAGTCENNRRVNQSIRHVEPVLGSMAAGLAATGRECLDEADDDRAAISHHGEIAGRRLGVPGDHERPRSRRRERLREVKIFDDLRPCSMPSGQRVDDSLFDFRLRQRCSGGGGRTVRDRAGHKQRKTSDREFGAHFRWQGA